MRGYAQPYAGPRFGISWLLAIYLIVGGIVAATHDYWSNIHAWKGVVSGVLATALWPLILLGIDLHIHYPGRSFAPRLAGEGCPGNSFRLTIAGVPGRR